MEQIISTSITIGGKNRLASLRVILLINCVQQKTILKLHLKSSSLINLSTRYVRESDT